MASDGQVNPFTQRTWGEHLDCGLNQSEKLIDAFLEKYKGEHQDRFLSKHQEFLEKLTAEFKAMMNRHDREVAIKFLTIRGKDSQGRPIARIAEIILNGSLLVGKKSSGEDIPLVYNLTAGHPCAMKKVSPERKKQIQILSSFKDPIPGIYYVYRFQRNISYDRVYLSDLNSFYMKKKPEFELGKLTMIQSLIKGLAYLHGLKFESLKMWHNNLNPKKIFIEPTQAVIGGFDFARRLDSLGETALYMSPEKMRKFMQIKTLKLEDIADYNKKWAQKDDIYALGLIFAYILRGPYPKKKSHKKNHEVFPLPHFKAHEDREEFLLSNSKVTEDEIHQGLLSIKNSLKDEKEKELCDLVQEMLHLDPSKRPSAKRVEKKVDKIVNV